MEQNAKIENFLKEKHEELSDFLVENMSYEETGKSAKMYSYKLGQYDMITELSREAGMNLDYEK